MTVRKLHETLSPLERWLKQVGFSKGNPFEVNEADQEPFVPECFVDPGVYDTIKDESYSVLVFAPRGSGKSALRVMLAASCRPADSRSRALAVVYTDFVPALEACDYNMERLTVMDHITQILGEACSAWLDALLADRELAKGLSTSDQALFSGYCQQFNPILLSARAIHRRMEHDYLDARLGTEDKRKSDEERAKFEAVTSWTDLQQAVSQRRLGAYLQGLSLVCSPALELYVALVDKIPEPLVGQASPKKLLQAFADMVKRAGLEGVCILVDRLDEQLQTFNNVEKLAALVAPLVTNLPLMELPGVAYKLFLPHEAQEAVMRFVRPERVRVTRVDWNDERLKNLLTLRLSVYSDDRVQSLGKLCVDMLSTNIEEEMIEVADGSPRRLLRLGEALLEAHARISKGQGRITEKAWKQAVNDILGSDYVRPLRVDREKAQVYVGRMTQVKLTPQLYRLVLCLYEKTGFCTNTEILRAAWGDENYTDDTVRQAVARVKKGLRESGVDPDLYVVNEPGRGYKLQNTA